jgi:polyhydroxybutyrate depolymerase
MRRICVLIVAALFAAGCGAAEPAAAPVGIPDVPSASVPTAAPLVIDGPGRYDGEVVSDGVLRSFVVHVPASVPTPSPLVLVFHGFTSSPDRVEELSGMTRVADAEGFIVAYPAALGYLPAWTVDDERQGDRDVGFARDLVAAVAGAVDIDADRVYAAGMSNGGGMAGRLACDAADLIAAVGPVAGAHSVTTCDPVRPVPVVAFHGTADRIVPYDGFDLLGLPSVEEWAAGWAARDGCSGVPEVSTVTDDVERRTWTGCAADVVLYTVDGGRHGWPGSDRAIAALDSTTSISASEIIWEFFAAHPRR